MLTIECKLNLSDVVINKLIEILKEGVKYQNDKVLLSTVSPKEFTNFRLSVSRIGQNINPAFYSEYNGNSEIGVRYKFIADSPPDEYLQLEDVFSCEIRHELFPTTTRKILLRYGCIFL